MPVLKRIAVLLASTSAFALVAIATSTVLESTRHPATGDITRALQAVVSLIAFYWIARIATRYLDARWPWALYVSWYLGYRATMAIAAAVIFPEAAASLPSLLTFGLLPWPAEAPWWAVLVQIVWLGLVAVSLSAGMRTGRVGFGSQSPGVSGVSHAGPPTDAGAV